MSSTRQKAFARFAALAALLAWTALVSGCVTTGEESDIPWNDPQPWEGSPGIPGLNDY